MESQKENFFILLDLGEFFKYNFFYYSDDYKIDELENNLKDYEDLLHWERGDYFKINLLDSGKTLEIIEFKKLAKLILMILNLFPDNYHLFIYYGLSQLMKNNPVFLKNYVNNCLKLKKVLLELESSKFPLEKEFYLTASSLLGSLIGDSLGSFVEFSKPDDNNKEKVWTNKNLIFGTIKGQVTDDCEMALSLLCSLVDSREESTENNLITFYYGLWIFSNPFDLGNTIRTALCQLLPKTEKLKIGNGNFNLLRYTKMNSDNYFASCEKVGVNSNSLSNGFLMRHTPISIHSYLSFTDNDKNNLRSSYFFDNYNKTYQTSNLSKNDVSITHGKECSAMAAFYDFIIFCSIYHSMSEEEYGKKINDVYQIIKIYFFNDKFNLKNINKKQYEDLCNFYKELEKCKNLSSAIDYIKKQKFGINNIGFYLHAIKLCIFALKYLNEMDYKQIMLLICNLGGDTDTNCCIVGGVIGAIVGIKNIYETYVDDSITFIPHDGQGAVPRPLIYSPGFGIFLVLELMRKIKNEKIIDLFDFSEIEFADNKFRSLKVLLWLFINKQE